MSLPRHRDAAEVLQSSRLLYRSPRIDDAPSLFSFLGDVDTMRYTQSQSSLRNCRRYLAGHACQTKRNGYGPWVVVSRTSNEIVGFGGLYEDPFDPGWGLELGYYFARAAWGQGYATELAQTCLRFAAERDEWLEVRAFAHPNNTASQSVLAKVGFMFDRFIPDMNRNLYVRPLDR